MALSGMQIAQRILSMRVFPFLALVFFLATVVSEAACPYCCREFHKHLQQYANPSICPMVLCRGKCAGKPNACGSLSGSKVLDIENPGHFVCERNCKAARN
jgi:hypothetical protein